MPSEQEQSVKADNATADRLLRKHGDGLPWERGRGRDTWAAAIRAIVAAIRETRTPAPEPFNVTALNADKAVADGVGVKLEELARRALLSEWERVRCKLGPFYHQFRLPQDGDVDGDTGQWLTVGGEIMCGFEDSDEGEAAAELVEFIRDNLRPILAALTTPAPDKALMPEAAVGELANLIPLLWCWDPETDDRTLPLLVAEAGRRDARSYDIDDAENVIAFLLSLLTTPTPVEEPANAATGEPVLYISAGQLALVKDRDEGGTYLPVRKTSHGNFTTPLYLAATNAGQVEALHGCVGIQSNGGNGSNPFVKIYFTEPGQEVRFHEFLTAALTNGQATGESK